MPVSKVCEQCGTQFNVPPRRAEEVKFCSRVCKTEAGRLTLTCAACGKLFERVRSDRKRSETDYCSRDCYHAGRTGVPQKADPSKPRYFKTCETCKTEFRVTLTRKDTARFCSRACKGSNSAFVAECSDRQQGDKHWRWAGGKYKTGRGYVRNKRVIHGVQSIASDHRAVITEAMMSEAQGHPFLVVVGGFVRLRHDIEVHHIDRVRENNAITNLLAVTKQAHAQIHHRNRKPEPWECWPPNPVKW